MTTPEIQKDTDALMRSLTNQMVTGDTEQAMENLRIYAKNFGRAMIAVVPKGRERAIAVHALEESVMWAIKALALEKEDPGVQEEPIHNA